MSYARFDQNGDLWVPVAPDQIPPHIETTGMLEYVPTYVVGTHGRASNAITYMNLTKYMRHIARNPYHAQ